MKRVKKKKFILILILFIGIVSSYAYFTTTNTFENIFRTKKYGSKVEEVFTSPDDWKPGDETEKVITATNTGNVCENVRVSYEEKWENQKKEELPLVDSETNENVSLVNLDNQNDWEKKGNYYYYRHDLLEGESTTSFLKSVTFNPNYSGNTVCTEIKEGNEIKEQCKVEEDSYAGGKYTLTVKVETIQCEGMEEEWGIKLEEIQEKYSITYHLNGGEQGRNAITSYHENSEEITLPKPKKEGYIFEGWYENSELTGEKVKTIPTGSTGNKEYYAAWSPVEVNVMLNDEGATTKGSTKVKGTYGENLPNITIPKKEYTITYDPNNGEENTEEKVSYVFDGYFTREKELGNEYIDENGNGNQVWDYTEAHTLYASWIEQSITLPHPSKRGYILEGWYEKNTKVGIPGANYTPTKDITLKAKWSLGDYEITCNLNHGQCNNCPTTYTIESETFTLPEPTRTGYTFDGWIGSNGSTPEKTITIPKGTTGNQNYEAKWTPIIYTISYTLNGGSANNPSTYTVESESFQLTKPTKTGYTFKGWTGSNGEEEEEHIYIHKGSTGNREYIANFTEGIYQITLNKDHGSGGHSEIYLKYGNGWYSNNSATLRLPYINVPSRNGYTFEGYYTEKEGQGRQVIDVFGNILEGYLTNYVNDDTIYASWASNTYLVTLNDQSATIPGTTNVTATYGEIMPTIIPPQKTGYTVNFHYNGSEQSNTSRTAQYTFHGYYSNTNGNGAKYYHADGTSASIYTLTSATTLYASWTGGSVQLPTPNPRSGYEFLGWYTTRNGNTKVGDANTSYTPTSDITLYANWALERIKVVPAGYIGIYNEEDLKNVKNNLSGKYIVMADINLTETNWEPIGNNSTPFTGTFEGNHYTISNLQINNTSNDYQGLFGYVQGGSISNLTVSTGSNGVKGSYYVGVLVGYNHSGTITNVQVSGQVSGNRYVGGLVGSNQGYSSSNPGIISKGYADVTVSGSSYYVGGLVGYNDSDGQIEQSAARGAVTGSSNYVGGLVGYNYNNGSISNAYSTGNVNGRNYVGGLVGTNNGGSINRTYTISKVTGSSDYVGGLTGSGSASNSYWASDKSGVSTSGGGVVTTTTWLIHKDNTESILNYSNIWGIENGESLPYLKGLPIPDELYAENVGYVSFDSGTGSKTDPYIITTEAQLNSIRENTLLSQHYKLGANINLTETNWIPIGNNSTPFTGTFEGNHYTISNLQINNTSNDYQGLFGYVQGGSISNLTVSTGSNGVKGSYYVGVLVGYNHSGTITNVQVSGQVSGSSYYVGGLVGYNDSNGQIEQSAARGAVTGSSNYVGGLVGYNNNGSISNAYSTGNVTGRNYVGGLVGTNNGGSINRTYTISKVTGSSDYVGGLTGSGSASNSYWTREKSIIPTSAGGTHVTLPDMKLQSTYSGWDFSNIWKMGTEFPELR